MTKIETRSAFQSGFAIIRQSAPMAIGKHDWRLAFVRRDYDSQPLIEAEYRRNDGREHTSMTPFGPIHFDGRMWRPSGDWKSHTPKRLTILLDATPWARMRVHLRVIAERAERREFLHDNHTKQTLDILLVNDLCNVDAAYNGYWWLHPRNLGDPEWRLRGPFATSPQLRKAALRSLAFFHPTGLRPNPAEPGDSSHSGPAL